jgi:hypothetical protein
MRWMASDGNRIYDANWNPIPDVVGYDVKTGEVQRVMEMHNGLTGQATEGVGTMTYPAPLRVLPGR